MNKDREKVNAYMREWHRRKRASMSQEEIDSYNARQRELRRIRFAKNPEARKRQNEKNKKFMRRWNESLTPEQKADHLAKRRAVEIPRQRAERKVNPDLHRHEAREAYRKNPDKFKARQKVYRERVKSEVLAHYGGVCKCCGEDEPVFLSIDHIKGDGAKARKHMKASGISFYTWLQKNDYPQGFQVLCYNCNLAKRTGDECPHRKIVMERIFSLVKRGG